MICFSKCVPLSQFILAIFFFIAFFLTAVAQITLRLTLDRRVRRELLQDKNYHSFYDGFFGIWRALLFANASIFKSNRYKRTIAIFYEDIDIKSFANRFEKTFAYLHIIAVSSMILCGIIFCITKWFGIYEW